MARIHTDLSRVAISVAPSPATSGTSLGVTDANAALLPDTYPFWAVLVPTNAAPTRSNAEIVKVTAGSSSGGTTTFTIVRSQGTPVTTARSVTTSFDIYDANSSEALVGVATQAEVAAGTDNTKMVTPLAVSRWHMPPQGFLYNGKIVPSASGGALTVAIKTLAGTDPSASDPVYVRIGDTIRTITAALATGSLTTGSNWFNSGSAELATKEIDYFVYLLWNTVTSAVAVVLSRIPYAGVYSDLSNSYVNEKYGYIAGTAPNNTDQLEVIGRFAATLSAGSGHTWTVPSFSSTNLIQRPIYETRWLAWTPTFTGVSAQPAVGRAEYKIIGSTLSVNYVPSTTGTSNSTAKTITLPFSKRSTTEQVLIFAYEDNGAYGATPSNHAQMTAGSAVLTLNKSFYGGAWTASGSWRWFPSIFSYDI